MRLGFTWALFLGVLLVGLAGCNVRQKPAGPPAAFWENVRPASGETERLQRNARFLKQSGRLHLALKELEEAHRRDPDNLKIVDTLAQCCEELQDWERAEELYLDALARHNGHPALANNLGFSYYQAGNLAKAEACWRQNLKHHPGSAAIRNNLGLVLTRLGRQEEALALWQAAEGDQEARRHLNQALAALAKKPAPVASRPKTEPGHGVTTTAAQALGAAAAVATPSPKIDPNEPVLPATVTALKPQGKDVAGATSPGAEAGRADKAEPAAPTGPPGQAGPIQVQVSAAGQVIENASAGQGKAQAGLTPLTPRPAAPVPAAATLPASRLPILQADELLHTKVEILNGNGISNLARRHRASLHLEGFDTVAIGNHRDFGQAETAIIYRPQAARVAQVLGSKFFRTATLTMNPQLREDVEVRVILGRDILQKEDVLAKLAD
jgi:Tfp pilus assembly protein PilF